MKYFVYEVKKAELPPEAAVALLEASKEFFNARLADGTWDCAYSSPEGRGMCICNYDSHEALMDDMLRCPIYPFENLEVRPVVDLNDGMDKFIELCKKLTG